MDLAKWGIFFRCEYSPLTELELVDGKVKLGPLFAIYFRGSCLPYQASVRYLTHEHIIKYLLADHYPFYQTS